MKRVHIPRPCIDCHAPVPSGNPGPKRKRCRKCQTARESAVRANRYRVTRYPEPVVGQCASIVPRGDSWGRCGKPATDPTSDRGRCANCAAIDARVIAASALPVSP